MKVDGGKRVRGAHPIRTANRSPIVATAGCFAIGVKGRFAQSEARKNYGGSLIALRGLRTCVSSYGLPFPEFILVKRRKNHV